MPNFPSAVDRTSLIQWLLGALAVLLYARDRFDEPSSVWWQTTFARYSTARTGYMAFLIMLYLLAGGAFSDAGPPVLAAIIEAFNVTGAKIPEQSPGPLYAAVLFSTLLPHTPYLNKADEAVKQAFQRLGNIPYEYQFLGDQLLHTPLEFRKEAHPGLQIDPAWLEMPPSSLTYLWARIRVLHDSIRGWRESPTYAQYAHERTSTLDDITAQIKNLDNSMPIGPGGVGADKLVPTSAEHESTRNAIIDLHRNICYFVAGGLLSAGRGPKKRQQLLDQLEFKANAQQLRAPVSIHDVFLVGGGVFLIALFVALIFHQLIAPTNGRELGLSLRLLFMVSVIYCVSIVLAIYPKSRWAFADIRVTGRRPVMGYMASGALAVAATFLIQLLFRFVQVGSFTHALVTNFDRSAWYFMTFFTTMAIAWACDDYFDAQSDLKWLRAAETVGMGAAFAIIQWATIELLLAYSRNPERLQPGRMRIEITSTLVGALIGFIVPSSYRRGCRQHPPAALPAEPRQPTASRAA